ncbi:MAG: class I SAM-dependent methyltransferase [Nannocystaceae bacterium]|nr:class I SAM-dependent methyltransferase [bacterium]
MADGDAARWDAKYEGRPLPVVEPTAALQRVIRWLPARGGALDVAGGDGAQAVWMAQRGLDVALCDVSAVALRRAQALATRAGVDLQTHRLDLETDPLPAGRRAVVSCSNYLQPSLWPNAFERLEAGGVAIWIHPTITNLERNAKPSRRWLLEPGQGRRIFEEAGLMVVHAEESWVGARHLCVLVGRRDG